MRKPSRSDPRRLVRVLTAKLDEHGHEKNIEKHRADPKSDSSGSLVDRSGIDCPAVEGAGARKASLAVAKRDPIADQRQTKEDPEAKERLQARVAGPAGAEHRKAGAHEDESADDNHPVRGMYLRRIVRDQLQSDPADESTHHQRKQAEPDRS